MENSNSTQCVRVAVKVWPLITSELMLGCTDCISMVPGSCISIETLLFGVTSQSHGGSPLSTIHSQKAIGGVFVLTALLVLYGLVTFRGFKCEVGIAFSQFKPLHHSRHRNMAHFEKDEVPMLSETHAQLSDEVVDSTSLESYEKETSLVGHTGPLRSVRKTPSVQMSGPLYATNGTGNLSRQNIVATRTKVVESKTEKFSTFNGTDENRWDNDYNRKNEHLMRSGQLGMCNDPYCTTCPTYFKASQPRTRRTSAIFDPKFRLAYVSPESRVVGAGDLVDHPKKIALNYLKGYFFIDLFVVLPLPQIMISFVLRKYLGISGANFAKNLLRAAILLQYFPRLFRFLPLLIGQSPTGFIFESAWANFIINLFLSYLAMLLVLAGTSLVCRFSCCIKKEDKYLAQCKMKKQKKYYLIHLNASDFNLVVYNMIICYKNHKQNKL
ncbi:putative cyclic nucleotide-gated ion channel 20, chloroplastic [Glycine soja]